MPMPWEKDWGSAPAADAMPWEKDWSAPSAEPARKSLFGTPLPPERPDTYLGALKRSFGETGEKAANALRYMRGREDITKAPSLTGPHGVLTGPFHAAGSLYDLASSVVEAAVAPATAAVRHFVTGPQEYYTGMPAEQVESALSVVGPGKHPTIPLGTSPLELPGIIRRTERERPLNKLGPPRSIDMGELERRIQDTPAAISAQQQSPLGIPREGLDPHVRLLPAEVPHGRASVGAAGAEGIIEQTSPEAVQMLRDIVREQGFNEHTIDARLEEMSQHEMLAELTPDMEGHLGAIRSLPGPARNEITQTVIQRGREALDRIRSTFDRAFGGTVNRTQWENDIRTARSNEAAPFWRTFESLAIGPSPEITALLPRLEEAGALKAANKALREEGLPTTQGFGEDRIPTAQAFQLAKEHLDDLIATNVRAGADKAARRYTKLKNDLVSAIDNHPDPNVAGVWRDARQVWARHTGLLNARELGEEALTAGIRADELPELLAGMGEPERRAFLYGMRGRLEAIAGNPGRVENKLMNEIMSRRNQEKITAVLGEGAAQTLFSAIEHEQRMHNAPTRLLYGSPTAERRAYQQRWQPASGSEVTLEGAIGAARHPIRTAVTEGAKRIMGARSAAEEARLGRLREEVSRILTLQGPERDAVLRYLVQTGEHGGGGAPVAPRPTLTPGQPGALQHYLDTTSNQPLTRNVLTSDRAGRPTRTARLPIGNESRVIERAEQRLSEGPRIVSRQEQEAILRKNWEKHGEERDWDFNDWRPWDREVKLWNQRHPEKSMPGPGEGYQFGSNSEFERMFDEKYLAGRRADFPGVKAANEYFQDDRPDLTAYTSMRQIPEDIRPPKTQALSRRPATINDYLDMVQ